jgi:protein-tyrosine-phosphatase
MFSSGGISRAPLDLATVAFMRQKGEDISRQTSKSLDQIPYREQYQVVIALSKEGTKAFPASPTKVVCLDWSRPMSGDMACLNEPVEDTLEHSYLFLQTHIKDLVEAVLNDDP